MNHKEEFLLENSIETKEKKMPVKRRTALEVLVAAVEVNEVVLAEQMNLSTNALICNQCQETSYDEFERKGCLIRTISMKERGVGKNRNRALMSANASLVLFADDDIVYDDDYEEKIINAFEKNPVSDILLFNVSAVEGRMTYHIRKQGRVRWYNYGRYPTYAVCAKLDSLRRANVWFSLLYGGGAPYSNGEDSLFLRDCLKKKLRIDAVPIAIGHERKRKDQSSTWFTGYNRKFFYDRGVLYHDLYGHLQRPLALRFLLAHKTTLCQDVSIKQAYHWMVEGMREVYHSIGRDQNGKDLT